MRIEEIEVSNFKSFKHLKVNFKDLNVIIGPNASGKTNFLKILEFVRDIFRMDLKDAIALQGGLKYIQNLYLKGTNQMKLEISMSDKGIPVLLPIIKEINLNNGKMEIDIDKESTFIEVERFTYQFTLNITSNEEKYKYEIVDEDIIVNYNILENSGKKKEISGTSGKGSMELCLFRKGEVIGVEYATVSEPENLNFDVFSLLFKNIRLKIDKLMIREPYLVSLCPFIFSQIRGFTFFDINPKLSKKAVPIIDQTYLKEDGNNIPIVLEEILKDKDSKRKFFNLLNGILDYIRDVNIKPYMDNHLLFSIQEKYNYSTTIPSFLVSEGTINIISLIIILFFELERIIIIEEPERNIHPYLMSGIVDYMKDASRNKQIIVTTHNPEFVKHVGIENILLIYRNDEGYSVVSRPSESEEVQHFLKKEIGVEIDDLFINNMLHD